MGEFVKEGMGISLSMIIGVLILIILVYLLLSGTLDQVITFFFGLLGAIVAYMFAQLHGILR